MKFEGFNTPKCSLLAPSNIDDPIFELASCNKTPAKCPPPLLLKKNLNKLPFVFLLKMNVINQSKIHY